MNMLLLISLRCGLYARIKKNPLLNYFQESYEELKKVTWPTRNKAIRLTGIVLVLFCHRFDYWHAGCRL